MRPMLDRNREFVECHDADVTLYLHVQPRASRTAWSGVQAGRMKLRLAAPPVDDRANRECVAFVAKTLRLAKSKIRIARGHSSRQKTLVIDSATPEATAAQLRALAAELESASA